ncbi:MAG: hypothetical protein GF350_00765 [Chitinivibrionales bacterium]|nr:hypothetical protein [Chitinivibrionales bacterium]
MMVVSNISKFFHLLIFVAAMKVCAFTPDQVWFDGGAGYGTNGIAGIISGSINKENHLITLRYCYNEEFEVFMSETPAEKVWDIGALYGVSVSKKFVMASFSTGLSYVGGIKRGEHLYDDTGWFAQSHYDAESINTVGIPIQMQVNFTPFFFAGIGITGFANLNVARPFTGAAVTFRMGKLR